jgi:hypothetical protein
VLFAPLVEALGRDRATLVREHGLERAAPQRVGAGVEQEWASLAAAAGKVDPEPRHSGCERLAAFGEERRHLLGRRDVGIVFKVDERAREAARDFAPLFEAADTIAHGGYGSLCPLAAWARRDPETYMGAGRCGSLGIMCATLPARRRTYRPREIPCKRFLLFCCLSVLGRVQRLTTVCFM